LGSFKTLVNFPGGFRNLEEVSNHLECELVRRATEMRNLGVSRSQASEDHRAKGFDGHFMFGGGKSLARISQFGKRYRWRGGRSPTPDGIDAVYFLLPI
jgi:hypothetical protein